MSSTPRIYHLPSLRGHFHNTFCLEHVFFHARMQTYTWIDGIPAVGFPGVVFHPAGDDGKLNILVEFDVSLLDLGFHQETIGVLPMIPIPARWA